MICEYMFTVMDVDFQKVEVGSWKAARGRGEGDWRYRAAAIRDRTSNFELTVPRLSRTCSGSPERHRAKQKAALWMPAIRAGKTDDER